MIKITKGVAKVVETPKEIIRVQILYNDQLKEKADYIADYLNNFKDSEFDFDVIDKGLFTIRDVNESFIINRTDTPEESEKLADILDLEEDLIVQKVLSENKKHITLTLVVGKDAEFILTKNKKDEE
jgi:hypothetical protein